MYTSTGVPCVYLPGPAPAVTERNSRYLFSVVSREILQEYTHSLLHDVCLAARCPPLPSSPLLSPPLGITKMRGKQIASQNVAEAWINCRQLVCYVSIQMSDPLFRSPFIFSYRVSFTVHGFVQSGVPCVHRALYTLTDHLHVSTTPTALLLISCLVFT